MSLQGTFQGVPRDLMILIISWVLRVLRWSEQPGWVFPGLQPQGEEETMGKLGLAVPGLFH